MSHKIDTVIVGGGQAGLAISYYLTQEGREHVTLERAPAVANAWRNQRWDSFTTAAVVFVCSATAGKLSGSPLNRLNWLPFKSALTLRRSLGWSERLRVDIQCHLA